MIRASVCMATYNGQQYLSQQISSILGEMSSLDELIIVDDASSDSTVDIVDSYSDQRIKCIKKQRNSGVNETFELALREARGEYLLLSDQDDVWTEGRLDAMIEALKAQKVNLVVSNYSLIDEHNNVTGTGLGKRLTRNDDKTPVLNLFKIMLGKMNYYGCAMAFTSQFRDKVIPFPKGLECHDLWLTIVANMHRDLHHIEEDTLMHRIHGNNASILERSLSEKLLSRIGLLKLLYLAWKIKL